MSRPHSMRVAGFVLGVAFALAGVASGGEAAMVPVVPAAHVTCDTTPAGPDVVASAR